jgi:hypothetical protein
MIKRIRTSGRPDAIFIIGDTRPSSWKRRAAGNSAMVVREGGIKRLEWVFNVAQFNIGGQKAGVK